MQFSVRVPQKQNPQQVETVVVEARDSLSALRVGLEKIRDNIDMSAMVCDFSDPVCLRVTDPSTGRVIVIAEYEPDSSTEPDKHTPSPQNTAAKSPLPVTEDLPAIEDLPETREMPSANTDHLIAGVASSAMTAISDTEQVRFETSAQTELYIPSFSMEQALQIKNQSSSSPDALGRANPTGQRQPEPDFQIDEATMLDPSLLSGNMAATMLETLAVPDSRMDLAAAPAVEPVVEAPAPKPAPIQIGQPAPASTTASAASGRQTLSIRSLTGSDGKYKPGMTTETLATVFMRAMDIYDHSETSEAMKFVLELGMTDVPAVGGGVLLTDINSPDQVLWFEKVIGPQADLIQNFRVPLGQGIIGYCAQQGVSQNIADVHYEPRYQNDVLRNAGLEIGSLMCVPIQHQKRTYGAIVFYNPPGERPFTQGELSILSYLAHVAGEYLGQQA